MEDSVLKIGVYILPFPVALSTVLGIFFSLFNKSDGSNEISSRVKNGIALLLGVAFGYFLMMDKGLPVTFENLFGYGIYGLIEGAAAVGLYKSAKIMSGKG
jgi:hypothetical protein